MAHETLPLEFGNSIITAQEIENMDFSQFDVITLSACQTGAGGTISGAGIHGFRRSFEIAGAHLLVCTLWEVDDLSSTIFMTEFYRCLHSREYKVAEALNHAKEYLRNLEVSDLYSTGFSKEELRPFLKKIPVGEKPFSNIRYWAGYVLQGRE